MTREEVHDAFSMVLQDTWLFEGSIRENLVFNQRGISDEAVEAATPAVGVHHFIRTLPNGYDTVLDDSVTLSVGQKQLLTIARSLLKDAPLLILDEATSSVDTRAEELIQKAMDKLMEGRTDFLCHCPSLVDHPKCGSHFSHEGWKYYRARKSSRAHGSSWFLCGFI